MATGPVLKATLDLIDPPPFIYVSGATGAARAVESLRQGATDFVMKQQLSGLVPAVRRALKEHHEVAERRAAEAALRESEERFRRMLEHAHDIVYRYRFAPRPGFEYISPALERVLGVTVEQLLSQPDFAIGLVHPEDRALLPWPPLDENHCAEVRVRRNDGTYRWIEVRSRPVHDTEGRLVASEGVGRDVTDRHEADELMQRHVLLQGAVAELGAFALAHTAEETVTGAVATLSELLDAEIVGVFRTDGEHRTLWAGQGWPTERASFECDPAPETTDRLTLVKNREAGQQSPADALIRSAGGRKAVMEQFTVGGQVLGTLIVAWKDAHDVHADERAFIEVTANVLSSSINRSVSDKRLQETVSDLRVVDEQRRRLLSRLVSAQEEERRRIAADVHDDSIQIMTAAALRLEMLRDAVGLEDIAEYDEVSDVVRRSIERLRSLMFALHPPQLDREGLTAALRLYVDATTQPDGPHYALHDNLETEPQDDVRALLYRIAQEALTNVRKHARAGHVTVTVFNDLRGSGIAVGDDGCGFEAREFPHDHLGVVAMRERAELAGGTFSIESAEGRGTTITAWVPACDNARTAA